MICHEHKIIQLLAESDLELHLTGSRYLKSELWHSDYDFYCVREYSKENDWGKLPPRGDDHVKAVLTTIGLEQKEGSYCNDPGLWSRWHWASEDASVPNVDVLVIDIQKLQPRLEAFKWLRKQQKTGQDFARALKGKPACWALFFAAWSKRTEST